MSHVFVSELPEMLFDAQRADACMHRYHQNKDVFVLEKWRSLVESACQSGDLAAQQGMVDIEVVNDWLSWPVVRLWSVFRLHNPLLPDMDGQYDKAFAEIGEGLKARIAEADPCLERDWDNLTTAGRYKRVIVCDSLNGPKSTLFFALGNICFWDGDASGKSIHGALVAEIESWTTLVADRPSEKELRDTKLAQLEQSTKRCDAVRERLLAGVIPEGDETGEIIDLLRQFVGETWCSKISFPIWLEKVEETENRWSRRQLEDAFSAVREPVTQAWRCLSELSVERCAELAGQHELFIDHWIELTGFGIGQHESYEIGDKSVNFRKWQDESISAAPAERQAAMQRDNRTAPHLAFPCMPAELLEFIDTAIGIHCFSVPDTFRQAMKFASEKVESTTPATVKPLPAQRFQEREILRVISELGYAPTAMPKDIPGKPGVKAEVRARLNFTTSVFDKAWGRLSSNKEIIKLK